MNEKGKKMKKVKISAKKYEKLKKLYKNEEIIAALAIDQRGSLKKMLQGDHSSEGMEDVIVDFKKLVSKELTPFASSILLDPEYGLAASKERDKDAGLLLAYEKTGYDATEPGRLPDLLEEWSVYQLKDQDADAIKFLLYYDVDEAKEINEFKHRYMERVGAECQALDIPFFLEIVTYDAKIEDAKGREYAKVKPHKVIKAMEEFSKDQYFVDVLKMEVPVNMNYVEGYTQNDEDAVYSLEEAKAYFYEQSNCSHIPYIFLSAGVSMDLFKETLQVAKDAKANFNGVLCGRATWKDAVGIYAQEGEPAATSWLQSQGRENIESLNHILFQTATPWSDKFEVIE